MKQNMMIHIEGEDNINIMDDDDDDPDKAKDNEARKFLEELKKVGPYSKQILNYSYPPLLYQRGDDDEDDEDDIGGANGKDDGLPDFGAEFDEDEDKDISELIQGSGLKN